MLFQEFINVWVYNRWARPLNTKFPEFEVAKNLNSVARSEAIQHKAPKIFIYIRGKENAECGEEHSDVEYTFSSAFLCCGSVLSDKKHGGGWGVSPSPVQTFEPWAGACRVTLEDWSAQGLSRQHSVFGTDEVFKLLFAIPAWAYL